MRHELERMRQESLFFKYAKDGDHKRIEELIEDNKRTLKQLAGPPKADRATLVGNMQIFLTQYAGAIGSFEDAVKAMPNAKSKKWALFGLNQARAMQDKQARAMQDKEGSGRKSTVDGEELTVVIDEIAATYGTRTEPRAQVLGRTTELICRYLKGERGDVIANIYGVIQASFDRVDGQLSFYSQLQKRNIARQDYDREMRQMFTDMRAGTF